MAKRRKETWDGGWIHRDKKGRPTYIIRKMIGGVRYEVSTRRSRSTAATTELARFEQDPENYVPGGGPQHAIVLDDQLTEDYLQASADKGNSTKWMGDQRRYLGWWSDELRGRDLRKVTLRDHVHPALDRAPGAKALRIAVLKALYAWLRERDRIVPAEDPTFGKLKVPQARAAQDTKSKVFPREHFEEARKVLEPDLYRDVMDVMAGTGWHLTETRRFAGGRIEEYRGNDLGVARVLVCPRHKSGGEHRTAVSPAVAEAAARLRANGGLSESRFHRALKAACEKAKVPFFRPGWFRHTVATTATEAGAANLVPGFLGHRSSTTTRKFYSTRAVPPKVPTYR